MIAGSEFRFIKCMNQPWDHRCRYLGDSGDKNAFSFYLLIGLVKNLNSESLRRVPWSRSGVTWSRS